MNKKQRIDSITGEISTFQGAVIRVEPPSWVSVPDEALPFWDSITRARAANRWNESDLEAAAELARTKARIERLNIELDVEGDVVINARGTPIVNPKHNLLETMTRRMIALSRSLQVHAEATQGKSREQVKGNQAQAQARELAASLEDDLLPGVSPQ